MGRHRRNAFIAAPLLVVALLAGSACSSKKESTKPFCTSMSNSDQLFSLLTVKGSVDPAAFKDGIGQLTKQAPPEVHDQIAYIGRVYDAYFKVADKQMTVAEFNKRYPKATIQSKRAEVDGWMRRHCGFGIDG